MMHVLCSDSYCKWEDEFDAIDIGDTITVYTADYENYYYDFNYQRLDNDYNEDEMSYAPMIVLPILGIIINPFIYLWLCIDA